MQSVKFADITETRVEGLAIPFGGPFNGRDLDGEFFSKSTELCLDWYEEIPLLYHHGRNGAVQTSVVGRVKSRSITDVGAWAEAELDLSNKYFEVIKKLIKAGKLFFSSGSVFDLIQKDRKSGEITRWPWIELSLTPTPANPLAVTSSKAMPAGVTPVDSEDGDPPEGSYEDLIADLNRALMMMFPMPQCPCLLATFPDYCIVSVCEMPGMDAMGPMPMDMDYYRVAYTLDDMGEPVLGESVEVQRMYVPGSDGDDMGDGKAIDLRRLARKQAPLQSALTVDAVHAALLRRAPRGPRTLPADNQQTLRATLASLNADFDRILAG